MHTSNSIKLKKTAYILFDFFIIYGTRASLYNIFSERFDHFKLIMHDFLETLIMPFHGVTNYFYYYYFLIYLESPDRSNIYDWYILNFI